MRTVTSGQVLFCPMKRFLIEKRFLIPSCAFSFSLGRIFSCCRTGKGIQAILLWWHRPCSGRRHMALRATALPSELRCHIGALGGTRTPDPRIKSPLLYHLSYERMESTGAESNRLTRVLQTCVRPPDFRCIWAPSLAARFWLSRRGSNPQPPA